MKSLVMALCLMLAATFTVVGQEVDRKSAQDAADVWAPFRMLEGKWTGDRKGFGEEAKQTVEFKFVMGGKFLKFVTSSESGDDPHEDMGLISYDKSRKKFVLRAFFSEGFVNQYVAKISDDGNKIEFETEAIENGPPGMRAKEIMTIDGNQLRQELLLASGDKPFESCVVATLKRVK